MEEKLFEKCVKWLDLDDTYFKNITTLIKEDEGKWHRRIYLAIYEEDKTVYIYLIRVFSADEINISLSEDYYKEKVAKDFIKESSAIFKEISDVLNDVR